MFSSGNKRKSDKCISMRGLISAQLKYRESELRESNMHAGLLHFYINLPPPAPNLFARRITKVVKTSVQNVGVSAFPSHLPPGPSPRCWGS